MTNEEAIRISIRKFYDGKEPLNTTDDEGNTMESKYSKAFFDQLEEQVLHETQR